MMRLLSRYSATTWLERWFGQMLGHLPFEMSYHDIPIASLPEAFHGFTLVQVSDLHLDRWNTPMLEAAIGPINALNADLLVCTGDTIAEGSAYLGEVAHLLRQLKARHGKLACLGNHDYYDGNDSYSVRHALRRAGFDVLVNESTELTLRHQKIQLAGADDLMLGSQCLETTTRRLGEATPTVLLSHNPGNFDAIARFQPALVLSGHTHGGQVQIPQVIKRHLMRSSYIAGLYQNEQSRLYVNRGLGSAILVHHWHGLGKDHRIAIPTPRLAVHPEISIFRLIQPQLLDEVNLKRADQKQLAG